MCSSGDCETSMEHDQLKESSNHSKKVVITYTSSGAGRHSPGKATTWQDMRVTMTEGFVIFAPKTEAKEEASTSIYNGVQDRYPGQLGTKNRVGQYCTMALSLGRPIRPVLNTE